MQARPRLVRIAESILKNHDDAEDVVQSTMIILWKMHSENRISNMQSYSNRAVWLNSIKHLGHKKKLGFIGLDDLKILGIPEPSVTENFEDELSCWELEDAILDLPLEQQAVIRLRFYSDMSFKEIGRSLSISLNTAASRCRYALIALRQAFNFKNR
jgi:RNA polymerase sigma-70 factor (ECF subfamily)